MRYCSMAQCHRWCRSDFLDMVFLDGDHRYETVTDDIKERTEICSCFHEISVIFSLFFSAGFVDILMVEVWWPKLRSGGVLAGHDFAVNFPGVVQVWCADFSTKPCN